MFSSLVFPPYFIHQFRNISYFHLKIAQKSTFLNLTIPFKKHVIRHNKIQDYSVFPHHLKVE